MPKFPHTAAHIGALAVFVLGSIVALFALQQFSSIGGYLKAVPVLPDGACYISFSVENGEKPVASCLRATSAKECKDQANGRPYLFVPGGVCPRPDSPNRCEQAGVTLLEEFEGGSGDTADEAEAAAQRRCYEALSKKSGMECPIGCDAYTKYYAAKCSIEPIVNSFNAYCRCTAVVACGKGPPVAELPQPILVPPSDGETRPPGPSVIIQ